MQTCSPDSWFKPEVVVEGGARECVTIDGEAELVVISGREDMTFGTTLC